jgi:hypothetical protein
MSAPSKNKRFADRLLYGICVAMVLISVVGLTYALVLR